MRPLVSALQFLTVFRLSRQSEFDPEKMLPLFPVVGIFIGGLLALLDGAASFFWEKNIVSLLDVLFLAGVTGGLHLDGLGDTADGLYGHRPKEKALEIMRDSRIGAMGMVAIYFGLSVKWAAIAGIDSGRTLSLIIVPALARASLLFGTRFLPYGRPEGLGKDFFSSPIRWRSFSWVLLPIGLSFFLGGKGFLLLVGFFLLTGTIVAFYKKRLNCITGDMLGAMNEICEAGLFLILAMGSAL